MKGTLYILRFNCFFYTLEMLLLKWYHEYMNIHTYIEGIRITMKQETLESASLLFKALSDAHRLAIVYNLSVTEMNVGKLADTLSMEQSAVSHQLKILKAARLVKSRREGQSRIYSLADGHVHELINQVMTHVQEKG